MDEYILIDQCVDNVDQYVDHCIAHVDQCVDYHCVAHYVVVVER